MRIPPHEIDKILLTHGQTSMLYPGQSDPEEEAPGFYSVSVYARRHGVHPHTVLNWIKAGRIPYTVKFAGQYVRYLIPAKAIPPMSRIEVRLPIGPPEKG